MRRQTIRADEVRVGDRLEEYEGRKGWPKGDDPGGPALVVRSKATDGEGVELWTAGAMVMGMPDITLAPSDQVTVWR